jgi:TnpA family transposase
MLPPILQALEFRSNNAAHRPVIEALSVLERYAGSPARSYAQGEEVPLEGVVPPAWEDLVVSRNCSPRVDRVGYEVCVLGALRDALRRREVWVVGADRYRDPDEDLPQDFEERREAYYAELGQPLAAERFVEALRDEMRAEMEALDAGLPQNPLVSISESHGGRISVSPLERQPAPPNLGRLRGDVLARWPMTGLLDILKEADLCAGFTDMFATSATREALPKEVLRKRLLLCLYGLGTNTGLKRVSAGDPGGSEYGDLRYVRRKYVTVEHLRAAIAHLANKVFRARSPGIWGEATTACASDSKKFGAWDQNLMTEWSIRHRGRGVMIYWHVEKKSVCVYSQLKSVSSSEVAAMIEGVLRHCTDMTIEKNFVDSHGQSEVAFAFSRLLGFELLPRLKAIGRQKLYRPEPGRPDAYPNLAPVLTRPIDWTLIRRHYDHIVKYATALRLGTADAESILRRFSRGSSGGAPMHPTYRALAELGKALKTVFLCRYLREEALRREVHEGLNTIESWNAANSFIFYGKGGEVATNRLEDQEVSVLSLHLLQTALVYVNTLMIQEVLASPSWRSRLTLEDLRGLTPLIFSHVNPYGLFLLDMDARLNLSSEDEGAA